MGSSTPQKTITCHPTLREFRKIMDSKVTAGRGYVIVPWRVFIPLRIAKTWGRLYPLKRKPNVSDQQSPKTQARMLVKPPYPRGSMGLAYLPNISMEPKNQLIERQNHHLNLHFCVPCQFSIVYFEGSSKLSGMKVHRKKKTTKVRHMTCLYKSFFNLTWPYPKG